MKVRCDCNALSVTISKSGCRTYFIRLPKSRERTLLDVRPPKSTVISQFLLTTAHIVFVCVQSKLTWSVFFKTKKKKTFLIRHHRNQHGIAAGERYASDDRLYRHSKGTKRGRRAKSESTRQEQHLFRWIGVGQCEQRPERIESARSGSKETLHPMSTRVPMPRSAAQLERPAAGNSAGGQFADSVHSTARHTRNL